MRATQFVGLSPSATEFITSNSSRRREVLLRENNAGMMQVVYDDTRIVLPDSKVYSTFEGMCFDEFPLMKYFINGQWWFEKVQFSEWSSGPVIATKLVSEDGENEFSWTEEEYEKLL